MNMNIHENEPRLTITGERGNARIGMGVLGGESVLLMFDEQGNVIWGAP